MEKFTFFASDQLKERLSFPENETFNSDLSEFVVEIETTGNLFFAQVEQVEFGNKIELSLLIDLIDLKNIFLEKVLSIKLQINKNHLYDFMKHDIEKFSLTKIENKFKIDFIFTR